MVSEATLGVHAHLDIHASVLYAKEEWCPGADSEGLLWKLLPEHARGISQVSVRLHGWVAPASEGLAPDLDR